MSIGKFNAKHRIRKSFSYSAFDLDRTIFASQVTPPNFCIKLNEHDSTQAKICGFPSGPKGDSMGEPPYKGNRLLLPLLRAGDTPIERGPDLLHKATL
mgnify:CR=1 FL=1